MTWRHDPHLSQPGRCVDNCNEMFRQRRKSNDQPEDAQPPVLDGGDQHLDAGPEPGPELLKDGALLARWFVTYELDKELLRARRHERPLSVMVLTPAPILGERASGEALNAAAEAAQGAARTTDLIAWLPNGGIVVIMPETDKDGAAAAAYRWRSEMYTRNWTAGGLRWNVTTIVDPSQYETGAALLEALTADLAPGQAA